MDSKSFRFLRFRLCHIGVCRKAVSSRRSHFGEALTGMQFGVYDGGGYGDRLEEFSGESGVGWNRTPLMKLPLPWRRCRCPSPAPGIFRGTVT